MSASTHGDGCGGGLAADEQRPVTQVWFLWSREMDLGRQQQPKTKSFCCALHAMKDDGSVPATCRSAPALCHKACSVLAPLPCSQHFQSAVMSRGLFFVLLLYTVGFRNSLSTPHFSSLKIGRAASSLSSESCAHVWLVDAT